MNDEERLEPDLGLEEYVKAHVKNEFLQYKILRPRGYADLFDLRGPDREQAKRIKEQCIVDEWAAALYRDQCPFVELRSCPWPKPDCELVDSENRKIGVEITELVDEDTIKRNQRSSYHWKEYTLAELGRAIERCLVKKDGKLRRNLIEKQRYHRMIVILHTDEPALAPEFCREALATYELPKFDTITEAYVLFPCPRKGRMNDKEADYCRVVAIPLRR